MTATVAEIPHEVMVHITDRITHEVPDINHVLYDFIPKPTVTVEKKYAASLHKLKPIPSYMKC